MTDTVWNADVGIVVVHGIGDQHSGETLATYGREIADYVVDRAHAVGVPAAVSSYESHIELEWGAPAQRRRCEITEGWWAHAFATPRPAAVLTWTALVAPIMLHRHSMQGRSVRLGRGSIVATLGECLGSIGRLTSWLGGGRRVALGLLSLYVGVVVLNALWREPSGRGLIDAAIALGSLSLLIVVLVLLLWFGGWWVAGYLMIFGGAVRMVVVAVMTPVVQAFLLLLALLASVPLPFVQRGARWLAAVMSSSIGDSLAFVQLDESHQVIVDAVDEAIASAAERCRSLVIVAHSQGGAVVERALARSQPANLSCLVTLGSGLAKLGHLRDVAQRRTRFLIGAILRSLIILGSLTLVVVSWRLGWETDGSRTGTPEEDPTPVAVLLLIMLVFVLFFWGLYVHARAKSVTSAAVDAFDTTNRRWHWLDVYASADLVPDGGLDLARGTGDSVEVANDGSVLTDHVTYHENPLVLDLITERVERATAAPALLAYSDQERAALAVERNVRTAYRRASYGFFVVVSATVFGLLGRVVGVQAWPAALLGALVASPFAGVPWHRWHERATWWERRGATVATWTSLAILNPKRWVELRPTKLSEVHLGLSHRLMLSTVHDQRESDRAKLSKLERRRARMRRALLAPFHGVMWLARRLR